jgi:peptide/nickel transport system ATP-binding protein
MAETVLRLNDVRRQFDVSAPWLARILSGAGLRTLKAVDGVSLDIARGETFALVGESGCGKSTVARLVVGLYEPSSGSIEIDGTDIASLKTRAAQAPVRRRVQMVFQDPYASLNPRWRVKDIIAEPIRTHSLIKGEAAIRARVDELLRQVSLTPADGDKYPHAFSGGQRQRISIARALLKDSPVLVLDEATAALDNESERRVQQELATLMQGRTTLVIAHRLSTVESADRIIVLDHGRIAEMGSHQELLARGGLYAKLHGMQFKV